MADATDATEASKLRVALALAESLRTKRVALGTALATSAAAFHRAGRHTPADWRGCGEAECKQARAALLANGDK